MSKMRFYSQVLFLIHPVTLGLLVGVFIPFISKVIIDRYVFIVILLLVLWLFLKIFSDPFLSFFHVLLIFFSDMFGFLSLYSLHVY